MKKAHVAFSMSLPMDVSSSAECETGAGREMEKREKLGRRVARGNPELSGFPMQTNNCFPLLATGGPPGVIQRRGVGRRNGEINNAGQATGAPGVNFITFMFFMVKCICIFLAWLMGILGLRGYAALIVSWGSVFRGENIKPVRRPALPGETKS